jgi:hypothetical protein
MLSMSFEEWAKKYIGRSYADIISEINGCNDDKAFHKWAQSERLGEFLSPDWAMFTLSNLNERITDLEGKKKDKK